MEGLLAKKQKKQKEKWTNYNKNQKDNIKNEFIKPHVCALSFSKSHISTFSFLDLTIICLSVIT